MQRYGFWALLIVVAATAGAGLSYKPWRAYLEQRKTTETHRLEMERAERRRSELAREKSRIESFAGREAMAREQGFMRKEEAVPDLKTP